MMRAALLVRWASTAAHRQHRIAVWDRVWPAAAALAAVDRRVTVNVAGAAPVQLEGRQTTAWDALVASDPEWSNRLLGARVNGALCDVRVQLADGDHVAPVVWEDDDGKAMLWHSAAHLLGNALELLYPDTLLCDGPALSSSSRGAVTEGFYYELHTAQTLSSRDFDALTASLLNLAKQKRNFNPKFERMQLPVSVARTMFEYNPFKMALLDDIAARNEPVTVYRCGDFIDLCRGPHVPNTGRIKWAQLTRTSSSHRSADGPLLQRVYGVAFGSADHGREWQERVAEAERRDHRAIAVRQGLAMWNELSAGSAFFLPDGTFIYNRLLEMLRVEYGRRGFQEVITPQLFDRKLWEQSGHWEHYRNDMFLIACNHHSHDDTAEASEPTMGLKPMNCPAHCLIFAHQPRSHHDLPLRLADFGALHRNEHSGALTGLTRVRKFQQDDAHIFCSEDQLGGELRDCLTFLRDVYARLGFVEWSLRLSTRPADYVGELALWDKAEATLRATLEQSGMEWALNPGDGAFYGPKVDVCVRDAMGRLHQCGTIQLDFQLPRRFGLHFTDAQQNRRVPVMIHRAILGSVERMFAVLAEHCGGRWPVWLNPRMVAVVPVADAHHDYATSVVESLCRAGVRATALTGADTMAKKIRAAQLAQYSFILVVGDDEVRDGSVSVRVREDAGRGVRCEPLAQFRDGLVRELDLRQSNGHAGHD